LTKTANFHDEARYDGALRVQSRGVLSLSCFIKALSGASSRHELESAPLFFSFAADVSLTSTNMAEELEDKWM
jgi:hypothetical protein